MIDHLLGRPSPNWKRTQVLLVIFLCVYYLKKAPSLGPKFFQRWSNRMSRFAPWQIVLATLTGHYFVRNIFLLLGLNAPEPLARLYSRSYYRATWIMTALDAGFWTAMPIKPKFLRDIFSVLFTGYYAMCPDQADEKVRKTRALITVQHMRVSWEKSLNPIIRLVTRSCRPRLGIYKRITIPRPQSHPLSSEPINAYLFYSGTEEELAHCDELVLDLPGGGFVAMPPPCHDEYLSNWAVQTKCPIVSIDYGKAPEYPYPWAIEECFDAYRSIMETDGACVGINTFNPTTLRLALVGDSAGGNFAMAVMYKILEYPSDPPLPSPNGIVLIYPCLDFNITSWMPPQQLELIRAASMRSIPGVLDAKDHLSHKSPLAVVPDKPHRFRTYLNGSIEDSITRRGRGGTIPAVVAGVRLAPMTALSGGATVATGAPDVISATTAVGTRLTMTSRVSYFEDRIITPDMMRAMGILYIGPNAAPNFAEDYYLSPIVGPDHLLERFPPVYMMCGEKDPFVDDTVVLGGRIRNAKRNVWLRNRRLRTRTKKTRAGDARGAGAVGGRESEDDIGGIAFAPKSAKQSSKTNRNGYFASVSTSDVSDIDDGAAEAEGDTKEEDDEEDDVFNEAEHCTVKILEGMSHGYLNMLSLLPEARGAIRMSGSWLVDILENGADPSSPSLQLLHQHRDSTSDTVSHKELAAIGRTLSHKELAAIGRAPSHSSQSAVRSSSSSSLGRRPSRSRGTSPESLVSALSSSTSTSRSPDPAARSSTLSTSSVSHSPSSFATTPSSLKSSPSRPPSSFATRDTANSLHPEGAGVRSGPPNLPLHSSRTASPIPRASEELLHGHPSPLSPRAARRRAAAAEKGVSSLPSTATSTSSSAAPTSLSTPNAEGGSAAGGAHTTHTTSATTGTTSTTAAAAGGHPHLHHQNTDDEWERKNVIATEKELMARRRGNLDRYFPAGITGTVPPENKTATPPPPAVAAAAQHLDPKRQQQQQQQHQRTASSSSSSSSSQHQHAANGLGIDTGVD